MKHYLYIVFAVLLASLTACGNGGTETPDAPETLVLKSASVADGAEVETGYTTELVLEFNKMVKVGTGELLLNEKPVSPTISASTVTVPLDLEGGKTYTFAAPAGAFVSVKDAAIKSEAITIRFNTKKEADLAQTLSNPDATASTKKVYAFLLENYGKKMLSASMANVNWNFSEAELVNKATGKYPAIATMDYIHMLTLTSHSPYHGQWTVAYDNTTAVEAWWQQNGLIAASWHWMMPANESAIDNTNGYSTKPGSGSVGDNTTTCVTPTMVMTEGSWAKTIADEDLAKMAELLLLLQDKGIPVIWRPFHEASGNTYGPYAGGGAWFWWGIEGAEKYKALWRYVYDYMHTAGVNNLIWVWTSQNNGDTDWYPGDEYVDVIGQDIYNQNAASCAADYKKLRSTYPQKMVTLSECGNVGTLSEQWQNGARWSYAMPWYQYNASTLDNHEHANTAWWQDAMSQTYVITRDKMPSLK